MRRGRHVDAVISELALRSCSVVHANDLREAGVSRDAIAHRVRAGWMSPILPRTYGVGPLCRTPTHDMRCMAAVLAGGPGSVIDGETAAALLDVWDRPSGLIHATVPGGRIRAPIREFRFHQVPRDWSSLGSRFVGSIPVTGFADVCQRAAIDLTPWQLAFIIRRGIYERLLVLGDLEAHAEAHRRLPGIKVLRSAIALVRFGSAGTRGRIEDAVLRDVIAAGLAVPLVNVRGALGLSRDEPDLVWPGARRNIEIDGGHHDDPAQAEDDRRRDVAAEELGWGVMRLRASEYWRRPRSVIREVCRFVEEGTRAVRRGRRRRAARISARSAGSSR